VNHHGAHAPAGPLPVDVVLLFAALLLAGVAYVVAARAVTARRAPWPPARTVRWLLGLATAAAGLALFVAGAHDLRLHVVGHLLLGMAGPLLLVTAAPLTLALRALPPRRARALGRLLRSRPVVVVSHPVVAALLDTGGLWLMYRTDLFTAVPPGLVAAHVLLAGYLFAFSLVGADPNPHRAAPAVRAGVLVAAVAAHDVLAKLLYAAPPAGVPAGQAEAAAMTVYYGGTVVHVALFVLLGREWARAQRRLRDRRVSGAGGLRASGGGGGVPPTP
jgi:putative membrane protein